MDLQFTDKVAVVTGGSKGIGRGIVDLLLREGASVVNVSRSVEPPGQFDVALSGEDHRYLFLHGDVSDDGVCREVVAQALDRFGRLDVLVNNAGVNDGVGLEAGPERFVQSLYGNLIHYYALAHYALESLAVGKGAIVNIGSKVAVTGQGGTSGYAAAKGAINALTREWALELAPRGIRVNTVIPAEVWTPMYGQWLSSQVDPVAARREIERLIPLGRRFTTVEEIAAMAAFLASDCSSHTNYS